MCQLIAPGMYLRTLHQQLAAANEKTMLQRQIEATDHEIDRLVYELYDLTVDEIKIVEAG
jgi:hypothetical protein